MGETRIVHPRRSRRAKMLGMVEDAARALAREGEAMSRLDVAEMVAERLGWGLNAEECRVAERAFEDEWLR